MDRLHGSEDPVRAGLTRRLELRIVTQGAITFPAVPALVDDYVDRLARVFAEAGRPFAADERSALRSILDRLCTEAFTRSQRSTITVSYSSTIAGPLTYEVSTNCMTLDEAYQQWVATREPPLFGVAPDARVWALACELDPPRARILDIGAGTGRNALALARRGHPVDVVEVTGPFAETIRHAAARESLDVRVIQRDVFAAGDDLRGDYSLILLSEVVPEFRSTDELRRLFQLAAGGLAPGGRLVFNIFLTEQSYSPDVVARQFAQQAYSSFFTRAEVSSAAAGLPLELCSDDSCFLYEQANLPEGAWPPTSWYAGWATGHDVFALPPETSPMGLRWLVYRRNDEAVTA